MDVVLLLPVLALATVGALFCVWRPVGGFIRAYLSLLCLSFISLLLLTTLSDRSNEQQELALLAYGHRVATALLETVCSGVLVGANGTCPALLDVLDRSHSVLHQFVSLGANVSRRLRRVVFGLEDPQDMAVTLPKLLELSHVFALRSLRGLANWLDRGFNMTLCAVSSANCFG